MVVWTHVTLSVSYSHAEDSVDRAQAACNPIPPIMYSCTNSGCRGNDHPRWGMPSYTLSWGRAINLHIMTHHVYLCTQSASCLSGGSLPGEQSSGLLEMEETRGTFVMRDQEERREEKVDWGTRLFTPAWQGECNGTLIQWCHHFQSFS